MLDKLAIKTVQTQTQSLWRLNINLPQLASQSLRRQAWPSHIKNRKVSGIVSRSCRGIDDPRSHTVHPNTITGPLHCQGLSKVLYSCPGGSCVRHHREASEHVGDNVDYNSTIVCHVLLVNYQYYSNFVQAGDRSTYLPYTWGGCQSS